MSEAALRGPRRGLAIASMVLGLLSLPTFGLLGIGALTAIALGVVALVKASGAPAEYGGRGYAVAGIIMGALSIVVIPFLGIVAAIAIPSLLRARISANEAAAIGDVRGVVSAEATYQSRNAGYFDRLECLAEPSACIPGYPGAPLLGPEIARAATKNGYRRRFHPGLAASPRPANASPTSMMSFAYVAVPEQQGRTGVRAFCGDATGRICYSRDGFIPEDLNGACPADCQLFR
jgi:type IV pilus assembly protein PilA